MEIKQKEIIAKGQLLRYHIISQDSDDDERAVLFLHGWRSDSSVWFPLMRQVAEKRRPVIALNLPGFGGSSAPKRPFMVADFRDVVYDALTKLGYTTSAVIGHSFGGGVALALAATYPDIVSRLLLANSAIVRRKSTEKTAKRNLAKIVKPIFKPRVMQPIRRAIYRAMGAEDYVATPHLTETYKRIVDEDLTPYLSRISQPTLIIWGENDSETPVLDAKIIESKVEHGKLIVLKDAGHFSFLDKPDEFSEELMSFLNISE